MQERNIRSWHMMINGYTMNGLGYDGLLMFKQMRQEGIRPDKESFALVLAACARAEAVEEGLMLFKLVENDYGIVPGIEHHLEVINILGNAGQLDEARIFIEKVPIEPPVEIWEALQNFARIHGDIDLEEKLEGIVEAVAGSKEKLTTIYLGNNPCARSPNYSAFLREIFPNIQQIDSDVFS